MKRFDETVGMRRRSLRERKEKSETITILQTLYEPGMSPRNLELNVNRHAVQPAAGSGNLAHLEPNWHAHLNAQRHADLALVQLANREPTAMLVNGNHRMLAMQVLQLAIGYKNLNAKNKVKPKFGARRNFYFLLQFVCKTTLALADSRNHDRQALFLKRSID